MDTKERFQKISTLRSVFESSKAEDIKSKVWKSGQDLRFSDRYSVAKFVDEISGDISKLSEISDENVNKMYNIVCGEPKKHVFFEDRNSAAIFLSEIKTNFDVDVRKIDDSIVYAMNDVCESIRSKYSDYTPHDQLTWGANGEVGDTYHQLFGSILIDNKMVLDTKTVQLNNIKRTNLMESVEVSEGGKDMYKMIYNVLDENSILLLYSYIFGHITEYSDTIRDKVYDYLQKNPTSPAVDMVTGTIDDDEMDSLMRSFKYIDAQSFLLGTTYLAFMENKQGKLCRVRFIAENKYGIKEIK